MSTTNFNQAVGRVGSVIGRGLIAGIAGTVAITIAQMIEMKVTGRGPSDAPAEVGGKVLGVKPKGGKNEKGKEGKKQTKEMNKQKFSQFMHWGYGTGWGVCRGLLSLANIKGPAASALHFGAVWGTELVMIPNMTQSPPATQWGAKALTKDAILHLVYAVAAGATFDAISKNRT